MAATHRGGAAVIISDAVTGISFPILGAADPQQRDFCELRAVLTWTRSFRQCSARRLFAAPWSGGEVFTTAFEKDIRRYLELENITNLYGPTEATIDAIGFACEGEQGAPHIRLAVLCPIRVYV